MTYNDKVEAIIKNNNFNSFWECFEFFDIGGFDTLTSFGISLKVFGFDNMFKNVAFMRIHNEPVREAQALGIIETFNGGQYLSGLNGVGDEIGIDKYIIGVIDESNKHLTSLYDVYRNYLLNNDTRPMMDIENTCRIVKLSQISGFYETVIDDASMAHFGKKIINRKPIIISKQRFSR